MARNGGRIEPNLKLERYGLEDGWITVTGEGVSITAFIEDRTYPLLLGHADEAFEDSTFMVAPEFAPLFRMVANRLDEIARRKDG